MSAQGRILLLTGLPVGLGASTVALALAEALAGMGRSVLLVGSLSSLGGLATATRPARLLGSTLILPQESGPDLVPLELNDEESLTRTMPLLARETDFVLLDRFTGLRVKDNPWYRAAGEVLLIVDGRPGQDTRSLVLAGHVLKHWPEKTLYVLHNRLDGTVNGPTTCARFARRIERHHGHAPVDLGCLPEAGEIARAGREGKPFSRMYANHPGSRHIRQVARQLMRLAGPQGAAVIRSEETLPMTWSQP